MQRFRILLLAAAALLVLNSLRMAELPWWDANTPVSELLVALGEEPSRNEPRFQYPGVSAERGRELVLQGYTSRPEGGNTARVSKHFVCTSCHNIQREDPDLRVSDPEVRLDYAVARDIPFLPGTTFYGIINRTSFYNGGYEAKYGELTKSARHNLREAVQLCATQCSQGRELLSWEIESILAYFQTLGLRLGDLALGPEEQDQLNKALQQKKANKDAANMLRSQYLAASPATFLDPPADRKAGFPGVQTPNPVRGQLLYEKSCLHCHEGQRYAFFELDGGVTSREFLSRHVSRYTRYSVYQVIGYGTSPIPGKRAYMPNYPAERMSAQLVEDLRAYIQQGAGD